MPNSQLLRRFRPSLAFILLTVLLASLWIAGGASRADAWGQIVVRIVAWAGIIAMVLFGDRPRVSRALPVALILAVAVVLVIVQLIPVPTGSLARPAGRALFADAAVVSHQAQPWRPLSISPGATINAASTLVVPIATLLIALGISDAEKRLLPSILLVGIAASAAMALLQALGANISNPFVIQTIDEVSGNLANRNHLALILAAGCIIAPVWAFSKRHNVLVRVGVAIGLELTLLLILLIIGSRVGLVLGALAVCLGAFIVRHDFDRLRRRSSRWLGPVVLAAVAILLGLVLFAGIATGRAVSVERAIATGDDLRQQALPTIVAVTRTYFPAGAGFGTFDPAFRIAEPFSLLKLTYLNHAHNDFIEVVLEGGIGGAILLIAALGWWMTASIRAWRSMGRQSDHLAVMGSAILLLIILASAFDYPARTPVGMALAVLAAMWLAESQLALPPQGDDLRG